jgi:hypothetical protein
MMAVGAIAAAPAAMGGVSATVDFEELTSGDTYGPGGTGGEMVGDMVFSDDGIGVFVDDFLQPDQSVFNSTSAFVEVDGAIPQIAFSTQGIEFFGNIALEFDFTGLAFEVGRVELEWADFGGSQTIGVNGELFGFANLMNAPASLDGVDIAVTQDQVYTGGVGGTIVFTGAIDSITIGGQEFGLDNVTAYVPAPGGAALLAIAGVVGLYRRR